MDKKKYLKTYKTPEEKALFYQHFWNRISLQERLLALQEKQVFISDSNDKIIPIDSSFKFSSS